MVRRGVRVSVDVRARGLLRSAVEALGHGTPVVAREAGAVAETLGGAGVVIDDRDLAVFAEALHEARRRRRTQGCALHRAAERRLESLAPSRDRSPRPSALAPLLDERPSGSRSRSSSTDTGLEVGGGAETLARLIAEL